MPLRRRAPFLVLASLLLGAPVTAAGQAANDDRAAVLAVVDSSLAAVSQSDFVAFTDFMLDSAVTFSAGERNGEFRMRFMSRAGQRAMTTNARLTERGFHPEVHLSGPLAVAWVPYDFYADGKWSHCGVDAFTLLKVDGRWRIAVVAWSVEQPPACRPHPAGPPPGALPPGQVSP